MRWGVALIAALALGLAALQLLVGLPAGVFWAAILAFLASVFLYARRRVGTKRAVGVLVLGLGLLYLAFCLLMFILILIVLGGPLTAGVAAAVLAGLAVRHSYLLARRRGRPLPEVSIRAPGLPLLGAVLTAVAFLLYGSSARGDGQEFFAAGLMLGILAGLVWLAKLFLATWRDRDASVRPHLMRWLMPCIVGIAGLLFSGTGIPFAARFELSRPAIDDAARAAHARGVEPNQETSLGLLGNKPVRLDDHGYVEFYLGHEDGWLGGNDWYLVQIPTGTEPPESACISWDHVDGPWWLRSDDLWCEL